MSFFTRGAMACMGAALLLSGCDSGPSLPPEAGYGPDPKLPEPHRSLIPVIWVAPAIGWRNGATPTPGQNFAVKAFATGLNHPRWLFALPNGDVLVAETNTPGVEPEKGVRGWMQDRMMKKAGARVPSPNRIILLRDADGDGVAETRTVFLKGLRSPFGMTLVGTHLFVANTDALMSYPYVVGQTEITAEGRKITNLPAWPIDHHWTKNVIPSLDGSKLYVSVGSNSNAGENGLEFEDRRASILEVNPDTGASRVYASGLRNPIGMDWNPRNGQLWAVVNERDELGNDLVPDYLTSVKDGGFYGWPYSYWGQHLDERVRVKRQDLVGRAIKPDYGLGSHTAAMGLVFYRGSLFPERYRDGAFVTQHGSWNRDPPVGYRVIFVPFANGAPSGPPEEVLGGFLNKEHQAQGRPVGIVADRAGALLVADDVGNTIWRLTPSHAATTGPAAPAASSAPPASPAAR
jgi:glucose/arabinose dehydrogenase